MPGSSVFHYLPEFAQIHVQSLSYVLPLSLFFFSCNYKNKFKYGYFLATLFLFLFFAVPAALLTSFLYSFSVLAMSNLPVKLPSSG